MTHQKFFAASQGNITRQTGEWTEFANDVCSDSGALIDDVFRDLLSAGLSREDIVQLENLSDPVFVKSVRGAILVSASSGGHEFPQVNTKAGKTRGASKDHLPAEAIQLTRSMLFAACIQAVSEQGTG